jgi:hypothetical protein
LTRLTVTFYSGSATIVNGTPTIIYPGLCSSKRWPNCTTGTLLAVALPQDHAADPLLTHWTKPGYNPILNNTQRDPSTAWFVSRNSAAAAHDGDAAAAAAAAAGEWRLTTYTGDVYVPSLSRTKCYC